MPHDLARSAQGAATNAALEEELGRREARPHRGFNGVAGVLDLTALRLKRTFDSDDALRMGRSQEPAQP